MAWKLEVKKTYKGDSVDITGILYKDEQEIRRWAFNTALEQEKAVLEDLKKRAADFKQNYGRTETEVFNLDDKPKKSKK